MSAKNVYHDVVVDALTADGWTVTHDPLELRHLGQHLSVDLAAERTIVAAEKSGEKIAVEIQSFLGLSEVYDLHRAIGQYMIYRAVLREIEPDRVIYLAVPRRTGEGILGEPFGQFVRDRMAVELLIFDETTRRVWQWTSSTSTDKSSAD